MDDSDKIRPENSNWDALERRASGERRRSRRPGGKNRRIASRNRRARKIKQTAKSLSIVVGICFFVALLISYLTGELPNLIDGVVSKNIEKAIQDTTSGMVGGNLNPQNIEQLARRFNARDRGDGSQGSGLSAETFKSVEGYQNISGENIEQLKEQYKDKYRQMMGR